ncbi:MFS transporter [Amycolatopsis thermoflava]|uniref:MFS transporter n=1 Tax=Amycolatopsis thermoflava TaxID=84480 RepID=UPI003EBFABD8
MQPSTQDAGRVAARVAARLDRLPVTRWHRKITFLVGVGTFFDMYEVFLGGVLAAVVAQQWHLTGTEKSAVVGAAFLGMFLGSNVLGILADRLGRRTMFLVNLGAYGLASLLTAASPNLAWLLVLRFITGLGVGAELTLVDTYLAEFLPRTVRGRYIAWAYTLGFLAVPIVAFVAAKTVAGHTVFGLAGWRMLLILGAVGSIVIWLARQQLPESPRWLAVQHRPADAEQVVARVESIVAHQSGAALPPVPATDMAAVHRVSLGGMFRGELRNRTIMWWIFQVLQTVAYYGFGALAPIVLTAKGFDITSSLGYAAASFLGYPVGSALSIPLVDRFERKRLIIISALGIALFGLLFGMATSSALIVTAGFLLTVCSNVFSNSFHIYQTEIFPTSLRSSAIGIAYSLSRLTSAVLPFVAITVLDHLGATAVFLGSAVLIGVLCLDVGLLGPRTTGRTLEIVAERGPSDTENVPAAETA